MLLVLSLRTFRHAAFGKLGRQRFFNSAFPCFIL